MGCKDVEVRKSKFVAKNQFLFRIPAFTKQIKYFKCLISSPILKIHKECKLHFGKLIRWPYPYFHALCVMYQLLKFKDILQVISSSLQVISSSLAGHLVISCRSSRHLLQVISIKFDVHCGILFLLLQKFS